MVGSYSFDNLFPKLFQVSIQKEANVIDMTVREVSEWVWDLKWRRDFFEWELVILGDLLQALERTTFYNGVNFWV